MDYKVSVIVPVYNKAGYISTCMESILGQTLEGVEVVCINDGSTDDSLSILRSYSADNKDVAVIDQRNMGVAYSRNVGIKESHGEFLAFMDPDDYYPSKDVLEKLYTKAKQNGVKICGGAQNKLRDGKVVADYNSLNSGYLFDKEGIVEYSDYQFDFGFQRFIYDREMIVSNGIDFPMYVRFQDPPFFVKAMTTASRFYAVKDFTYCYREAYKEVGWNLVKKTDMLRGLRDNLTFAQEKGLDVLADRTLERLVSPYYQDVILTGNDPFACKILAERLEGFVALSDEAHSEDISRMVSDLKDSIPSQEKRPKISVIVPVYNVEKYLRECLDSVLNQTFEDYEVICVNDGTKDGSATICAEFVKKDPRFRLVNKFNGGLSSSRNFGADYAVGKFIYFLDSDDYLVPNALERLVSLATSENLDIIFFDAETLIEKGVSDVVRRQYEGFYVNRNVESKVTTGKELMAMLNEANAYRTPVQLAFMRRGFYDQAMLSNYNGVVHEDNLFTFRSLRAAERAKYIPEPLYVRRIRADSIMTVKTTMKNYVGYSICCYEVWKLTEKGCTEAEKKTLAELMMSTDSCMKRIREQERPKINLISVGDKIRFCSVPVIKGKEYYLARGQPIATVVLDVKQGDDYRSAVNAVLNQTLWDTDCYAVSSSDEVKKFCSSRGVKVYPSQVAAISDARSEYIVTADTSTRLTETFVARSLDRIRRYAITGRRFVSEDGSMSAETFIAGYGCEDEETVDWLVRNEGEAIEFVPISEPSDDRLKQLVESVMTNVGLLYHRVLKKLRS
ncbi:MAG: glycosyltransferase [Candidatus Methanomethylophilaceae archaeon]|nr:glycosyltransferase [Candidatus Methanomethylophilaceae archaeon]